MAKTTRKLFHACASCMFFVCTLFSQTPHGFVLSGDPESVNGATWTYRDTVQSVIYDLAGILLKPAGSSMYPAVVISHGHDGNVTLYSRAIAKEMRTWGLVCIATNYTHAAGVPIGSPGDTTQPGASMANILRARKCIEIVASLGYVDTTRIAAHGHSMGAFVTAAVVGTYHTSFRVASHTAGGVNDQKLAWTKRSQANGITTPYQIHHGDIDSTVSLADDQRLDSLLQARSVEHQMYVYTGYGHNDIPRDTVMFQRVRAWYTAHGLFTSSAVNESDPASQTSFQLAQNYPNPFNPSTTISFDVGHPSSVSLKVFNILGREVATLVNGKLAPGEYETTWNAQDFSSGIYFYCLSGGTYVQTRKLVLLK